MAITYDSRRLRIIRAADKQLTRDHRTMARNIGALVLRAASTRNESGERIVSNTRNVRDRLKADSWSQVIKPYYIGSGLNPFQATEPQSPYARLLYEAIAAVTRNAAERQQALIVRLVADPAVVQWLTGSRSPLAITEIYDPFHTFVDPNGYRLSDRIWRASIEVRSRVDLLLDYHIAAGTGAVRIAELLEDFLTPGATLIRTRTPYGREGSYAARRLARTEITAAAGRSVVNASTLNPFVSGVRWVLSLSHTGSESDECDRNASGGPAEDGIYSPESCPPYPNHPHCKCNLQPVAAGNVANLITDLRADIAASTPRARALRGLFNVEWLTGALLSGLLSDVAEQLEAA